VEHEPEVEQDHSVGGLCPGIQLNAHAFWYWEEPLWVHIRKVDCPLCKGHIVVVPETVRYEGSRSMQGSYFVTFHMASLAYETRVDYVSDINTHWRYAYQPVVARRPRPRDLRFPVIERRESGGSCRIEAAAMRIVGVDHSSAAIGSRRVQTG
jgi:hypothetical protein